MTSVTGVLSARSCRNRSAAWLLVLVIWWRRLLIGDGSGESDVEGPGNGALTWPMSFRGSVGGQCLLVMGSEFGAVVASSVEALGVGLSVTRGETAVIWQERRGLLSQCSGTWSVRNEWVRGCMLCSG